MKVSDAISGCVGLAERGDSIRYRHPEGKDLEQLENGSLVIRSKDCVSIKERKHILYTHISIQKNPLRILTLAVGVAWSYMDCDRRKEGLLYFSGIAASLGTLKKLVCKISSSSSVLEGRAGGERLSSWLNCLVARSLSGVAISWLREAEVGKPSSSWDTTHKI